jgi:hypothetical protein
MSKKDEALADSSAWKSKAEEAAITLDRSDREAKAKLIKMGETCREWVRHAENG